MSDLPQPVDLDGTRFLRSGKGAALVFIHGVGMNARIWGPQIEAFRGAYDVIALDMLGHGGSRQPPADVKLNDYARQILDLLDALGVERAHIVGHSMGGLVALEFASAHLSRITTLSVLNSVFNRTDSQRQSVVSRAARLAAGDQGGLDDAAVARWFGDPVPAHLLAKAEAVRVSLREVDPVGYARTYALFAVSDQRFGDKLPHLTAPALFMTGTRDTNSTPEMARAMAALCPRGRSEILEGQRHMMAFADPLPVNERLGSFLREVAP